MALGDQGADSALLEANWAGVGVEFSRALGGVQDFARL